MLNSVQRSDDEVKSSRLDHSHSILHSIYAIGPQVMAEGLKENLRWPLKDCRMGRVS